MINSDSLDYITLDTSDILTIERFENNYYNHKKNILQNGGFNIEKKFRDFKASITPTMFDQVQIEKFFNQINIQNFLIRCIIIIFKLCLCPLNIQSLINDMFNAVRNETRKQEEEQIEQRKK
jgi:hypothetical protein